MRTAVLLSVFLPASAAFAGEVVRLSSETWNRVPGGKEVDAIYGDYVLRNDKVVAVIGDAVLGRHANMSVRNVQGAVIDFALLATSNDQLSAFRPHGEPWPSTPNATRIEVVKASGPEVVLRAIREATDAEPVEQVTEYALRDGETSLRVTTRTRNAGSKAVGARLSDKMRCDQTFAQTPAGAFNAVTFYDKWFGAAYAVVRSEGPITTDGRFGGMFGQNGGTWLDYRDRVESDGKLTKLDAGQVVAVTRHLVTGRHRADVQAEARRILGQRGGSLAVSVVDPDGKPVAGADVSVRREGREVDAAYTDEEGKAPFSLDAGKYVITVSQIGRAPKVAGAEIAGTETSVRVAVGPLSTVSFEVTDGEGRPSPCKVQFVGIESTPSPDLGPKQRHAGCGNLVFSAGGKFATPLPAGRYYVILSRGPEYDAAYRYLNLAEGKTVAMAARLPRVVESAGWVSADFHNHSTESGDNTTLFESRVVCLAAEGVEFAACTEHNRIQSYKPLLRELGLEKVLATSDGMELTGQPLPLNHHNAFPLRHVPRVQDGGGPVTDTDPRAQVKRLADHDGRSEKLVQQNHPDLGWLYFDKNGDLKPDEGFGTLEFTHVVEIWRPHILDMKPTETVGVTVRNNRVFNWLQLLNQGVRLPGVANTDAHYCVHESGRIRNYVKCSTDDPAQIREMEIVRESRKGRIVMTNGPFLDVSLEGGRPGDDVRVSGRAVLKVRVEGANWLDVDRVQVLLNGRPDPNLNFTRAKNRDLFGDGPVKFKAEVPIAVEGDAHVIVVAIGEESTLGPVMGATSEPPVAISNPIWVDADGNGFVPNKDTLGAPLPVKRSPNDR